MKSFNPAEAAGLAKATEESWWHRGMRDILFQLLDPLVAGRSIRTALDAGWGTGNMARMLQERYDWRVFPIATGWEGAYGVDRMARVELGALPFPDDSFDAVFSVDIAGNLEPGRESRPLQEMSRLLAPNGLLVLRVPALEIFRSRHSDYVGEQQRYTRDRLIAMVEPCGIRVLRTTYVNALLAPVALAKFRIWEPLMRRPASNGLGPVNWWLDRLLYAPLALESYWLGAGLNFPLGQSLLLIGERSG
jgi:SAM-dependent methyltransferase